MVDFIELSSENDNEIVDDIDRFIELFYSIFNSTKLNKLLNKQHIQLNLNIFDD